MKFLIESYEGIDYKGFEIEYNQDVLERAIEQAKEDGELHFVFDFFITKDGKRLEKVKSLKAAKQWIDNKFITTTKYVINDCINEWQCYLSDYTYKYLEGEPGYDNETRAYSDSFVDNIEDAHYFDSKEEAFKWYRKWFYDIWAEGEEFKDHKNTIQAISKTELSI